ncbi:hypothetical protein PsorP6_015320 [Peronosclerospora sorghi]|uniref:Uncharacterized protein n=1 Tax=Peronosclerospora sorghi TaxID=230839 RepID=A0ACC0VU76_9STRA|nr:hypothetical protein PsorP6_015320 [Peronosclerospora sorghi]
MVQRCPSILVLVIHIYLSIHGLNTASLSTFIDHKLQLFFLFFQFRGYDRFSLVTTFDFVWIVKIFVLARLQAVTACVKLVTVNADPTGAFPFVIHPTFGTEFTRWSKELVHLHEAFLQQVTHASTPVALLATRNVKLHALVFDAVGNTETVGHDFAPALAIKELVTQVTSGHDPATGLGHNGILQEGHALARRHEQLETQEMTTYCSGEKYRDGDVDGREFFHMVESTKEPGQPVKHRRIAFQSSQTSCMLYACRFLQLKNISPSFFGRYARMTSVPSTNPTHPENPCSAMRKEVNSRSCTSGHLMNSDKWSYSASTTRLV